MIKTPELSYEDVKRLQPIRIWLWFVAALVFLMVIVGGATRLTGSGLSITEWQPIHGMIPPLSMEQWEAELEKYRQIPQYQIINRGMSMAEFQFIYWWEWGHRFLGRIIGIAFFIPFVVFLAQKRVPKWLTPRLLVLFALGGLQGFIGWWMVTSGLVDRTEVSQYRLAVHLTVAAFIFYGLIWVAESLRPRMVSAASEEVIRAVGVLSALVLFQIFMGGIVAGLGAGMGYATWPMMNGALIPPGLFIMEPAWRNFFENALTVQFNHRIVAYVIIIYAAWLAWRYRNHEMPMMRSSAFVMLTLLIAQAVIGLYTVFWQVPLDLALIHQGGAFVILAYVTIWLRRISLSS